MSTLQNIYSTQKKTEMKKLRKIYDIQETNTKITELSLSLSVIILNANGLNSSIKKLGLTDWIKNHDPTICSLILETHCKLKGMNELKDKKRNPIQIVTKKEQTKQTLKQKFI